MEPKIEEKERQKTETWEKFWSFEGDESLFSKLLYEFREKIWVKHFLQVALDYTAKGKVLEAGSGSALSSVHLAHQRGDEITALDLATGALELAKAAAKKYNVPIQTIKHDMTALPYPDQSFDLVWNSGTLEHFENPVPVVREMLRVGKTLITIIPAKGIGFNFFLFVTQFLPQKIAVAFVEGNEHWYNLEQWKTIMEKAGCKRVHVKKIKVIGIFDYIAGIGYSS